MRTIKIEGYVSFMKNTKPAQMIVEDVLETGSLTLIHSGPGNSKTGMGFDMVASILTGKNWLGRFKVHTRDAYIFFISQDAPRYDVYRQSWKIFKRYFDSKNAADCFLLNSRFHIIDQNNIKLDSTGDVDVDLLIEVISTQITRSVEGARLSEKLREIGATGSDWMERLEAWREEQEATWAIEDAEQESMPTEMSGGLDEDTMPAPQVQPVVSNDPVILLLWDVMRRFHDGKESQSDELQPVFEGIRKINRALKATSILYHHDNRGGDYKGDSSVVGSVDVGFQLVPIKGDDPSAPIRTFGLRITKPRGIHVRPFLYRMIQENPKTENESLRFEYLQDGQVETGKKQPRSAKVAKVIEADPVMAAARRIWSEGMSVRGLHKTLTEVGKFKVSRAKVGQMIEEIRAERKLAG